MVPERDRSAELKCIRLLADIPAADLRKLAKTCRWKDYQAGSDIFSHQDTSTDVHFLTAGRARVVIYSAHGKAVVFTDFNAGEMFGELAAIDGEPRSASVSAVLPCTIASIPAVEFLRLIATFPSVAFGVVKLLATRIRRLDERVLEYSVMAVPARIQAELLRYGNEMAEATAKSRPTSAAKLDAKMTDSVLLAPSPSLADFADRISTHREAVSRELSRLTQLGMLKREGANLRIISLSRLADMVSEAKGD
jgi:CRP/FNR family transcriptional regulator, cyclic AMP receptor protein